MFHVCGTDLGVIHTKSELCLDSRRKYFFSKSAVLY